MLEDGRSGGLVAPGSSSRSWCPGYEWRPAT
jgi:hypothetical protein